LNPQKYPAGGAYRRGKREEGQEKGDRPAAAGFYLWVRRRLAWRDATGDTVFGFISHRSLQVPQPAAILAIREYPRTLPSHINIKLISTLDRAALVRQGFNISPQGKRFIHMA
jgi:hypothetical protein